MPVMLGIILSGIIVADSMLDEIYGALVATTYGWLILAKISLLILVLMIASRARSVWLPSLAQGQALAKTGGQNLRKWVRIEFVIAFLLVILATVLANTIPAKHTVIEEWPYPFRFSIDATWEYPSVRTQVWIGVSLLLLALGLAIFGKKKKWAMKQRVGATGVVVASAMAVMLPPLAVQAYPETYLNTPVPFDSISITNGSSFFAENCVTCHGPQGKGNGVLAKSFLQVTSRFTYRTTYRETYSGRFFQLAEQRYP